MTGRPDWLYGTGCCGQWTPADGCPSHTGRPAMGLAAREASRGAAVRIVSFGYLHGAAPEAHLTVDVRSHFRDPHVDPALRHMTAQDAEVMCAVLLTPGAQELITAVVAAARAFTLGPAGPVTVAIGCAGGRHRSAAIAIQAARLLDYDGIPVTVTHRDITRPVVGRRAA